MMYCFKERSCIYEQSFGNISFKDVRMSINCLGELQGMAA